MADGGKRSADNLLNGARSFKSQYLSRGGEEMEEFALIRRADVLIMKDC